MRSSTLLLASLAVLLSLFVHVSADGHRGRGVAQNGESKNKEEKEEKESDQEEEEEEEGKMKDLADRQYNYYILCSNIYIV